ncbi:MAG: oligosaccharide flippase family protein [Gammaproteobacteria bacterium]|nr:oligosaccharide flippase family protein [Gammaproteobacteria bacterium]
MENAGVRSILRNTAYLMLARGVTITARAVYILVIARLLGPELYGLFNYGLSWYLLFLPLTILGIDFVLLRELGRRDANSLHLLGISLPLRTASTVLVAASCLALGWWLETEPLGRTLLFFFSAALVGRGLAAWSEAIFKGREASGFILAQELVFRLLEVSIGLILLAAGFGVEALAAVHAAAWLLQGATGLYLVRRVVQQKLRAEWDLAPMARLLLAGLPFLAVAALLAWLMQGPLVLYRHINGVGAGLGQLALAVQFFTILGGMASSLGLAAVPVLTRSSERQDGKTSLFVRSVLRAGWLMAGTLVIGGLTVGPYVINGIFGPEFSRVQALLPWALLLVGFHFWVTSLRSVLIAHGQFLQLAMAMAVGAGIFTATFVPLVSCCDLKGALFATGLGLLSIFGVQLYLLSKTDSMDLAGSVTAPGAVVLVTISVTYSLDDIHPVLGLTIGLSLLWGLALAIGTVPKPNMFRAIRNRN